MRFGTVWCEMVSSDSRERPELPYGAERNRRTCPVGNSVAGRVIGLNAGSVSCEQGYQVCVGGIEIETPLAPSNGEKAIPRSYSSAQKIAQ